MAVAIDSTQAAKILGIPVDQCYVTAFLLRRPADGANTPFSCEIRFSMAMRGDDGKYVLTRNERTVTIPDVDAEALAAYLAGSPDIALADPAVQKAIAASIRRQCADLSTAHFVEVT